MFFSRRRPPRPASRGRPAPAALILAAGADYIERLGGRRLNIEWCHEPAFGQSACDQRGPAQRDPVTALGHLERGDQRVELHPVRGVEMGETGTPEPVAPAFLVSDDVQKGVDGQRLVHALRRDAPGQFRAADRHERVPGQPVGVETWPVALAVADVELGGDLFVLGQPDVAVEAQADIRVPVAKPR